MFGRGRYDEYDRYGGSRYNGYDRRSYGRSSYDRRGYGRRGYRSRGYDYEGYDYGGYEDEELPPTLGSRVYSYFEKKRASKEKAKNASVKCIKYTFDNAEISGVYVEIKDKTQEENAAKEPTRNQAGFRVLAAVFTCSAILSTGIWNVRGAELTGQEVPGTTQEQEPEGVPVMATESISFYAEASTASEVLYTLPAHKVVRALKQKGRFYKLDYHGQDAYVLCSKMLIGGEMEEFIKGHPFLFPETAEVIEGGASVFDCANRDCAGTAMEGEQFYVFGEKDGLFVVRYNDTLCYLPMDKAVSEIKVAVQEFPAYDNTLELREQVVQYAEKFVGNPYVWGGTDPVNGADCSGYVQSVMAEFGVKLPRTSTEQSECGREISLGDLKKGDLVFFNKGDRIGHVAIYAGNGKVLEAKGASYGIVLDSLDYSTVACARAVLD